MLTSILCWIILGVLCVIGGVLLGNWAGGTDVEKDNAFMNSVILLCIVSSMCFGGFLNSKLYYSPYGVFEPTSVIRTESGTTHVIYRDDIHIKSDHGRFILADEDDIVVWTRTRYTWWDNAYSIQDDIGLRSDFTNAVDEVGER